MANDIVDIYFKIGVDDKPLKSGLSKAGKDTSVFADTLKALLTSAVIQKGFGSIVDGFKKIANVIEDHVAPAVDRLDTLNSYSKTMTALGYSTDQATTAQKKLSDAIDGLPTTLDGIVSWQQQFVALSGSIEKSTDLTIALNNATLSAGKGQASANQAMDAWYKMLSAGVPDLQHWRSAYSVMPAQMEQLAKSMLGATATAEDLLGEWKRGKVTTEDIEKAFVSLNKNGYKPVIENTSAMMAAMRGGFDATGVKSFAEQAQVGAQTIATAYTNIGTAITKNVAKVMDAFNGDSSKGGGRIVDMLLAVKSIINAIGDTIAKFVKEHEPEIQKVMDALNKLLKGEDVTENFKAMLSNIGAVITDLFTRVKNFFVENKEAIADTLKSMFGAFIDTVVQLIPVLVPIAVQLVGTLVTTIVENLPMIIQSAVEVIMALVNGLADNLPKLIPAVVDAVILILNTIVDNLDTILEAALKIISALAEGLVDALPKLAKAIPEITGKIVSVILLHLPDIISCAFKIIMCIAQGLISALPEIASSTLRIIGTIADEFGKGFNKMIDRAKQWGADLISNFIEGTKKKLKNLKQGFVDIGNTIKKLIGFSEPEEGPLSNFHTFAPDMMNLFIKGILDNKDKLESALDKVAELPADTFGDMAVSSTYKGNGNGSKVTTIGDMVFNIYASDGQDIRALAKEVSKEVQRMIEDREKAYA